MRSLYLWVPLALFAFFAGLAGYMLTQEKDQFVESTMIGQPLPAFALEPAFAGLPGASTGDFTGGRPRLLNIWASWCLPCIAEAPQLEALKAQGAEIIGIAIRDRPEDVANFLGRHGNPYARIGSDPISEVQLAIGSSGVPETFVIDARGVIRYQHIGDIRESDVPKLLAELEKAK
ncbi:DsbE family thiol:disulfide interchange protein [Porphyrobacter sp. CACIAM 03H1]|uniref:DsbE family thiol:disulfide interchange protein n=1 Tax=Porphyrobacter sp. CACIAM 03H1 TaxID=2003315 RepID=UPI000B5A4E9B|nr:DsbE family thiol:disulfide interchange protein [Porphyrobacter sp. CACIAM 03H1]ASJ90916.1 DsbE family thiol:disulfide interchange protein [Porphyrobacter sp. CACIAM 03H1]